MKAESNVKPVQFEILPLNGDNVEVLFYENVETVPPANEEETEKYSYDYYRLVVRSRENLQSTIEANYNQWILMAKEKEAREYLYVPSEVDRLSALEDMMNFILGL